MPRQADNGFRVRGYGGVLLEGAIAVLAGNALYFLVLVPRLPAAWRHRPFALDVGLLLDFALCAALYALLRLSRSWFDSRRGRH